MVVRAVPGAGQILWEVLPLRWQPQHANAAAPSDPGCPAHQQAVPDIAELLVLLVLPEQDAVGHGKAPHHKHEEEEVPADFRHNLRRGAAGAGACETQSGAGDSRSRRMSMRGKRRRMSDAMWGRGQQAPAQVRHPM